MKKIIVIFLLSVVFSPFAFAQTAVKKYSISGNVRDSLTGEELIGAVVYIKELSGVGTSCNIYGFYSLTIPAGKHTVTAKFLGYESKSLSINLQKDKKINFSLAPSTSQLKEITVSSEKRNNNITKTQMGVVKMDAKTIKKVPVIFGEKDVLKTLQLTPGVGSAGDGSSGFYVRGGSSDQNLILLDGAPVFNASHLLGFFSVFNADAIRDVTLYKGNEPAQYGGRLSSVLDVRMQDGNNQNFSVQGGIGVIASRLKVEGPIKKGKGSFVISARRTYVDLFLKLSSDTTIKNSKLYFYDLNAKANYQLNDNNRIYLSGYFGKDVLGLKSLLGINWGNATGTLRWNHLFNSKLFLNTSLIFSNYDYNINIGLGGFNGKIISKIQDWNLKQDYQLYASTKSTIKFGFNSIYYKMIPGIVTLQSDSKISELHLTNKYAWSNAIYISHKYKPTNLFSIEYGLRLNAFSALGPGNFYTYNSDGETIDTASYGKGDFVKIYFNLQPRITLNYILSEKSSVKAAYARNVQNLHLLSNTTSSSPTDIWIPSSNNVKPEIADQISLGYFRNFKDNHYNFSAQIYYKFLQNQIDYKDGAQVVFNENAESQLLYGKGRAYGIELYFKKNYGKFTGWVSYTLSRSEKKITDINKGDYYPSTQDRPNDISIVGIYDISKKWTVSATWVYYTGNAVTFPSGKYEVAGQVVNYYTERNGYRMPEYNRLDIGVTWQRKKTAKKESSWNFSIYNAYGRENAYTITFQQDPDNPSKTQAVQTSLFRWVPSITYNFKF